MSCVMSTGGGCMSCKFFHRHYNIKHHDLWVFLCRNDGCIPCVGRHSSWYVMFDQTPVPKNPCPYNVNCLLVVSPDWMEAQCRCYCNDVYIFRVTTRQ